MTVREEASSILGIRIEKDGWDRAFTNLDKAGMITKKTHLNLILMILKRLEQNEDSDL